MELAPSPSLMKLGGRASRAVATRARARRLRGGLDSLILSQLDICRLAPPIAPRLRWIQYINVNSFSPNADITSQTPSLTCMMPIDDRNLSCAPANMPFFEDATPHQTMSFSRLTTFDTGRFFAPSTSKLSAEQAAIRARKTATRIIVKQRTSSTNNNPTKQVLK